MSPYSGIFQNDLLLSLPESFLCVSSLFLLLYGVLMLKVDGTGWQADGQMQEEDTAEVSPLLLPNLAALTVFTFAFTLLMLWNQPVEHSIFFFHEFTNDSLSLYLKTFTLLASIASILISLDYFKQERMNAFEYVSFIAFATLSVLLLIGSYDLLSVYLTIELQSLALYTLAASKRESEFSTEAGLKYFMLGALSSGILLFGISLLYGATGLTQFGELAILFQGGSPAAGASGLGIIFIAVALLFKMTAAPFHIWAPDVYEGAPTSVTALFSMVPKIGVTAVLLRFVSILEGSDSSGLTPEFSAFTGILLFSGALSVLLGGIAGLSQRRIKRLLAFSSIGHVGYLLIGLSCGSLEGYQAALLYLFVYTIITLATFTLVLSCGSRCWYAKDGTGPSRVRYIADFAGLGRFHPLLGVSFTVALFSLAGIPPFAGFFSKLSVFFAAISFPPYKEGLGYLVSLLAVCATCISAFYYLRIVRTLFFGHTGGSVKTIWSASQPDRTTGPPIEIDGCKSALLAICVFFLAFFFVYPSPLLMIAYKIALSLG